MKQDCYDLASDLFKDWLFIESANRYVRGKEGQKAISAVANAGFNVFESEKLGTLTESEAAALIDDLKDIASKLHRDDLPAAGQKLKDLSEELFISSLDKICKCEYAGSIITSGEGNERTPPSFGFVDK